MSDENNIPVADALTRYDESDSSLSVEDVVRSLVLPEGFDPSRLKMLIAGAPEYYWPAVPGQFLHGVVESRDLRPTKLLFEGKPMQAAFYTVRLVSPCLGVKSETGEESQVPAGKIISVLERTLLRDMATKAMGKEVIILCKSKGKTRNGQDLWRYEVAEVTPVVDRPALVAS